MLPIEMVVAAKGQGTGDTKGQAKVGPSLNSAVSPLAIPLLASVSGWVAIVAVLAQNHTLATALYLSVVLASTKVRGFYGLCR